ncbi:MAG: amidohydrolase family protein [Acidobacteria bacterium]|nr:amidohydrolase family protein [Acidobacteriota bacterium]
MAEGGAMKLGVALALITTSLAGQEVFDVLLKNGRVVDPKNQRDGRMDIGISKGRIRKIAASIPSVQARKVLELGDYIVAPGLIDLNANFGPNGVDPDHNELRACTTTAVDAGSADPSSFASFKARVIDRSKTRVLVFLSPGANADAAATVARANPQIVAGFRATGGAPLPAALSEWTAFGDGPGLRPGDIQTRFYREGGTPEAARGVIHDLGHGSDGFRFRVAAPAVKQGRLPDTISTGLDARSVMLPRVSMTNVMTKMMALGVPLAGVIERATSAPARALRRSDLGSLEEGGVADIAVLETRAGNFGLLDAGREKHIADREVRCVMTLRNGTIVWDAEGLGVTHWRDAGPYSNFK